MKRLTRWLFPFLRRLDECEARLAAMEAHRENLEVSHQHTYDHLLRLDRFVASRLLPQQRRKVKA